MKWHKALEHLTSAITKGGEFLCRLDEDAVRELERRNELLDSLMQCCDCNGWFPITALDPSYPDPESPPICQNCQERNDLYAALVGLLNSIDQYGIFDLACHSIADSITEAARLTLDRIERNDTRTSSPVD